MEAILAAPSAERQAVSPYNKQMKNPTKKSENIRGFIPSRPTENMAPAMNTNNIHAGLLFAPPPPPPTSRYFSCPPSLFSAFNNVPQGMQMNPRHQQPPLLPFPASKPQYNSSSTVPSRTKSLSLSPTTKKANRTRDHSLTPRKSKQPTNRSEEPKKEALKVASTVPIGPDPNELPKDVFSKFNSPPSMFTSRPAGNVNVLNDSQNDLDNFSGLVSTVLSPPPSSLPLPRFSMRPKLMSCTAEAAGVDDGATDNLCRLLRLR